MALINCSECGYQISDKAERCIYCFCPVEKKENKIICSECGNQLDQTANICNLCGCPVSEMEVIEQISNQINNNVSLIQCKACGKNVSKLIDSCIHCGCPIDKKKVKLTIIHYNAGKGLLKGTTAPLFHYVDDRYVGRTSDGNSINDEITIGRHVFKTILHNDSQLIHTIGMTIMEQGNDEICQKELDVSDDCVEVKIWVSITVGKHSGFCNVDRIVYKKETNDNSEKQTVQTISEFGEDNIVVGTHDKEKNSSETSNTFWKIWLFIFALFVFMTILAVVSIN